MFENFRLRFFHALALLALIVVLFLAPQQLPVIVYKLALVVLAVVIGYWLDRHMFPYAQPRDYIVSLHQTDSHDDKDRLSTALSAAMYRRVLLIAAVTIAFALAL